VRRVDNPKVARGLRFEEDYVPNAQSLRKLSAFRGSELVGYLTWYPESRDPKQIHLEMVRVVPGQRRAGVAAAMLRRLAKTMSRQRRRYVGCDVVWTGALALVDAVFGRERRLWLDNGIRELTDEEARRWLPDASPETPDGRIETGTYLSVGYDVATPADLRREREERESDDVRDALRHASEVMGSSTSPDDFRRRRVAAMPLARIGAYDDPVGWLEIDPGSLVGLGDDALREALRSYRIGWAERALSWRGDDGVWRIPPVVVVDASEGAVLGDGRGRYNLAVGLGLASLPVVLLTERAE
jgi:hypothetical protein